MFQILKGIIGLSANAGGRALLMFQILKGIIGPRFCFASGLFHLVSNPKRHYRTRFWRTHRSRYRVSNPKRHYRTQRGSLYADLELHVSNPKRHYRTTIIIPNGDGFAMFQILKGIIGRAVLTWLVCSRAVSNPKRHYRTNVVGFYGYNSGKFQILKGIIGPK